MDHQTTIIQIGKVRYSCELFWQVIEKGKGAKEECRKIAEEGGYDHQCGIDTSSHVMIGFASQGTTEGGKLEGTHSLAAALYETQEHESWAGIFKLEDNLWWYVGVRDGYMLPMGDLVSDNPEKLVEQFDIDSALGGWTAVYSPDGLLPRALDTRLEDLLPAKPSKTSRVRTRGLQIPWTGIGVSLLLLTVGFAGFSWYTSHEEAKRKALIAKKQAELAAKRAAMPVVPVEPWNDEMPPSVFAKRCYGALQNQPVVINGWRMVAAECMKSEVVLEFTRMQGSIPSLRGVYPTVEIANTGNSGTIRVALPEPQKRMKETLHDWSMARDAMLTFQQRIGVSSGVVPDPSAPPPVTTTPGTMPAQPMASGGFVKYSWGFSADFAPVEIAAVMEGIKGVTISSMKLDANTFAWNFKGELYGKK